MLYAPHPDDIESTFELDAAHKARRQFKSIIFVLMRFALNSKEMAYRLRLFDDTLKVLLTSSDVNDKSGAKAAN